MAALLAVQVAPAAFNELCYKETEQFGDPVKDTDIFVSDMAKIRALSNADEYYVHDMITCVKDNRITG